MRHYQNNEHLENFSDIGENQVGSIDSRNPSKVRLGKLQLAIDAKVIGQEHPG
jgi:hypothetical protein